MTAILSGVTGDAGVLPGSARDLIMVVGTVVAMLAFGGAFAYLYGRHRVFTKGVRGTALVVEVRPTSMMQRRSIIERPTENVTVATHARPRGVTVVQKLPAGQYQIGQIVPVVQARGRPDMLYLDRPDLEHPAVYVYGLLVMIAMMPVFLFKALTGPG